MNWEIIGDIGLIVVLIILMIRVHWLEKEVEAIKSWYPFCEIMKIRIPKDGDTK